MKVNCPTCPRLMAHTSQRCAWCWHRIRVAQAEAAPTIVERRPMPTTTPVVSTPQQQWTAFRSRIWPAWHA